MPVQSSSRRPIHTLVATLFVVVPTTIYNNYEYTFAMYYTATATTTVGFRRLAVTAGGKLAAASASQPTSRLVSSSTPSFLFSSSSSSSSSSLVVVVDDRDHKRTSTVCSFTVPTKRAFSSTSIDKNTTSTSDDDDDERTKRDISSGSNHNNNNNNNNNNVNMTTKKTKEKQPSLQSSSWTAATRLLLPGIALSATTAAIGFSLADTLSTASGIPISGIPLAILTGMALNNSNIMTMMTTTTKDASSSCITNAVKPGIQCATKTILQGGIVAVAAKLSFVELVTTGSAGLPIVLASVGAGLTLIPMYGHWAGLPKEMSLLLTAGTSICGVTAITALAPAIQASNRDIAVAVANTVVFGTIGMLTYPYLLHSLFSSTTGGSCSSEQVGICLGIGIHDTSQVLGAAMSYKETFGDEVALKVAAITKLTRNLGLAVAIPGLTYAHAMAQSTTTTTKPSATPSLPHSTTAETTTTTATTKGGTLIPTTLSGLNTFQKFIPPFLFAFVGMSCLRSTGDFLLASSTAELETFQHVMSFIGNDVSKYALGTAMAGVGLSTSLSSLQGVGWKPFAVGAAGAMTVGGTGFALASILL